MSTPHLCRMVVRVDAGLNATLTEIAARLFAETLHEYSHSAIVRGLIAIGLLTITDAPHLAPLFVGTRIARGRKRGSRRSVIAAPADLNLEFEDEHREDEPAL
jgi:hypothetical protein